MQQGPNILRHGDQEIGMAVIVRSISEALEAVGCDPRAFETSAINKSAGILWNLTSLFLLKKDQYLHADSSFFGFREKALANRDWLKAYGITGADWASAAIRQPQLFSQNPETLRKNFEANLKWLSAHDVTPADWAIAAVKQPQLFSQRPETLQKNFEDNMAWLSSYGLKPSDWASAAVKHPQLFVQKSATLRENFKRNMEWLSPYGVTPKDFASAAVKQSSLFYQKPETLQKNFKRNMEWLSPYGVTGADWASAAAKQPQLFSQNPETLQENFNKNMEWLAPCGVTPEEWASAALRQPSLFVQKPMTLQKNFNKNMEWLSLYGVAPKDWASTALKQPSLFYQKPKTLQEKFELLMVVSEMPSFKPHGRGLSFRETRVSWVLSQPKYLTLAKDNLLLRLAFAELTKPKAGAALISDARSIIESKFVKALGFDSSEEVASCIGKNAKGDNATPEFLKAELRIYADQLRKDWRLLSVPAAPRNPAKSILSVLLPMHRGAYTQEDREQLLTRMVKGGLLTGPKLPSSTTCLKIEAIRIGL